jgi:hypothetical protein
MVTTTIDAGGIDRAFEIRNSFAQVTITHLTIQNGYVLTGSGSGAIRTLGHLTLASTVLQNNQAVGTTSSDVGGAICAGCGAGTGSLTLTNTVIRNNVADRAGGIFTNVPMTIHYSSIISNSARAGGGLLTFAALDKPIHIVNSTISGNAASNNSGGIGQITGTVIITNSTIASNSAGLGAGLNYVDGTVILVNSIIAHNEGENCFTLGIGTILSQGHNLSSDATCNFVAANDQMEIDVRLLPLGDYGGDTPTHQLSWLSPAIDAGDDARCPPTDQRGVARMGACDIGAVEGNLAPQQLYVPALQKESP